MAGVKTSMIGRFARRERVRDRASLGGTSGFVLAALILLLGARPARAQLNSEDSQLLGFILNDLKYVDTAERYLAKLIDEYSGDTEARADLEWRRVDILNLQGKSDEAIEASEVLKKRYPNNRRAQLSGLQGIAKAMQNVLTDFEKANSQPEKAAAYRKRGKERFAQEVSGALDALVTDLETKVQALQDAYFKARQKSPEMREPQNYRDARGARDQAELVRVKMLRVYAGILPEVSTEWEEERTAALKRGLKFAQTYVEDRASNRLLQWQAQLQKGRYEIDLDQCSEAYDDISILVGITPPGMNVNAKIPGDLIKFIKKLHIEAVLYSAMAANCAAQYEDAAGIVEMGILESTSGPFALANAGSSPDLEKYHVLAMLERAIALAGSGQTQAGLDEVQKIIDRYSEGSVSQNAVAFVNAARKGLGRIAEVSGVRLSAQAYYEGAMGKFSQKEFEDAVSLFLRALESTTSSDFGEIAPQALVKIGEIQYIQDRPVEAIVTFLEVCQRFPEHDLVKKAANNAASIGANLSRRRESRGHAGIARISDLANKEIDKHGGGATKHLIVFQDAQEQESLGNLVKARDLYKSIPARDDDGKAVSIYLQARAKMIDVSVQAWMSSDADQKEATREDTVKYIPHLEKVELAGKSGQEQPEVTATWVLGTLYKELGEEDKMIEAWKPFLARFVNDVTYRGAALYYLVETHLKLKHIAQAEEACAALVQDFGDKQTSYFAILQLMEHFRAAGEDGKAADYILLYTRHPRAKEELEQIGRLMDVVDLLLEADRIDEAKTWLAKAQTLADSSDDVSAKKRLYFRTAKLAFSAKDYKSAQDSLAKYLNDFGVPPASEEDAPYILQMYGESILKNNARKDAPDRVKNLQFARKLFVRAIQYINQRRFVDEPGVASKAERYYWVWAYKSMVLNKLLGEENDAQAWVNIRRFITEKQGESFGGPKLKALFDKLMKEAEAAR